LSFAPQFDEKVVNDDLSVAIRQTHKLFVEFING
jgi:hypothetical protein